MSNVPLVYGVGKGVRFEWGDISFTLNQTETNKLLELIDNLQFGEFPDDLMTDLWVGKKMFRYGGHRIPIEIEWLYTNLLLALERYQERQHDAESRNDVDQSIKDIIEGLDL